MNFFDKLTDYVFDEGKKISSKAVLIILALLGVLLIDNLLGFSYSYSLDNKIDHVKNLNSIISDNTSDNVTKANAIALRKKVFERQNVFEKTYEYIADAFQESPTSVNTSSTSNITEIKANNFLFHISSSLSFYLVAIIAFPLILFMDKGSSLPQRLTMSFFLTFVFAGMGIFFYWICSLIPILLPDSWALNYACNAAIQIFVIFIMFKYGPQ